MAIYVPGFHNLALGAQVWPGTAPLRVSPPPLPPPPPSPTHTRPLRPHSGRGLKLDIASLTLLYVLSPLCYSPAGPQPHPPRTQGEVFSWGINDFGQLGNGTTNYATTPEPVCGLEGVFISDVAAGGWHSMALSAEGGAWGLGLAVHACVCMVMVSGWVVVSGWVGEWVWRGAAGAGRVLVLVVGCKCRVGL